MDRKDSAIALKHFHLPAEFKNIADGGEFEGYASTSGNVDRGGDIVEKGAFRRSLDRYASTGKRPKMLWQHDPRKVIGVWDSMQEDEKGLFVKGRVLLDLALGREVHTLMKAGAIDSMSIGYRTVKSDFEGPNSEIRRLTEVELFEVSLVTFPMNEMAEITNVKRLDHKGDVERILREAGVPGTFAKLVAMHGFDEAKAIVEGRRDGDSDALKQALERLRASTKRNLEAFNA